MVKIPKIPTPKAVFKDRLRKSLGYDESDKLDRQIINAMSRGDFDKAHKLANKGLGSSAFRSGTVIDYQHALWKIDVDKTAKNIDDARKLVDIEKSSRPQAPTEIGVAKKGKRFEGVNKDKALKASWFQKLMEPLKGKTDKHSLGFRVFIETLYATAMRPPEVANLSVEQVSRMLYGKAHRLPINDAKDVNKPTRHIEMRDKNLHQLYKVYAKQAGIVLDPSAKGYNPSAPFFRNKKGKTIRNPRTKEQKVGDFYPEELEALKAKHKGNKPKFTKKQYAAYQKDLRKLASELGLKNDTPTTSGAGYNYNNEGWKPLKKAFLADDAYIKAASSREVSEEFIREIFSEADMKVFRRTAIQRWKAQMERAGIPDADIRLKIIDITGHKLDGLSTYYDGSMWVSGAKKFDDTDIKASGGKAVDIDYSDVILDDLPEGTRFDDLSKVTEAVDMKKERSNIVYQFDKMGKPLTKDQGVSTLATLKTRDLPPKESDQGFIEGIAPNRTQDQITATREADFDPSDPMMAKSTLKVSAAKVMSPEAAAFKLDAEGEKAAFKQATRHQGDILGATKPIVPSGLAGISAFFSDLAETIARNDFSDLAETIARNEKKAREMFAGEPMAPDSTDLARGVVASAPVGKSLVVVPPGGGGGGTVPPPFPPKDPPKMDLGKMPPPKKVKGFQKIMERAGKIGFSHLYRGVVGLALPWAWYAGTEIGENIIESEAYKNAKPAIQEKMKDLLAEYKKFKKEDPEGAKLVKDFYKLITLNWSNEDMERIAVEVEKSPEVKQVVQIFAEETLNFGGDEEEAPYLETDEYTSPEEEEPPQKREIPVEEEEELHRFQSGRFQEEMFRYMERYGMNEEQAYQAVLDAHQLPPHPTMKKPLPPEGDPNISQDEFHQAFGPPTDLLKRYEEPVSREAAHVTEGKERRDAAKLAKPPSGEDTKSFFSRFFDADLSELFNDIPGKDGKEPIKPLDQAKRRIKLFGRDVEVDSRSRKQSRPDI